MPLAGGGEGVELDRPYPAIRSGFEMWTTAPEPQSSAQRQWGLSAFETGTTHFGAWSCPDCSMLQPQRLTVICGPLGAFIPGFFFFFHDSGGSMNVPVDKERLPPPSRAPRAVLILHAPHDGNRPQAGRDARTERLVGRMLAASSCTSQPMPWTTRSMRKNERSCSSRR